MDKIYVIKIGGNIIDNDEKLSSFLDTFVSIKENKILVHGGGKLATRMAEQLKIPQQMVNGRRVTDAETLKITTMVYAGSVNKNIVALLQQRGCNAIGLTGADANLITSQKRINREIDFGFVGDVEKVDGIMIKKLIEAGLTPVIAPITHNGKGQLLNTNADTIAGETGKSLVSDYQLSLIYCFEKKGVLRNVDDDESLIKCINPGSFLELKKNNIISEGMLPKLENALAAVDAGVERVVIGRAEDLSSLINGTSGTTINHE
jgi:acetylglutamate kinase